MAGNLDAATVRGFGQEWMAFDQSELGVEESRQLAAKYFSVFPFDALRGDEVGMDVGCGSGRWALHVAPCVGHLHLVDASPDALAVARRALADQANCEFHVASVDDLPVPDASLDFLYSLGVLHHIPDTAAGIAACARKLRPGAPMLVYLYYRFDNRPAWFRALWRASDVTRRSVARAPFRLKRAICDVIAVTTYYPLARIARAASRRGRDVSKFPLSFYADTSLYTMRTDALDRFGTRLEHRFTRDEIASMMRAAGLERVEFRDGDPYWCAIGYRAG